LQHSDVLARNYPAEVGQIKRLSHNNADDDDNSDNDDEDHNDYNKTTVHKLQQPMTRTTLGPLLVTGLRPSLVTGLRVCVRV